jgi:hypothetical protein
MRKTLLAIAAALLCATSAFAAPKLSPKDRKDTIEGLLFYEYVAWVATNNCSGMTWNVPLILSARKVLGMTEAEKTSGELALVETVGEINSTLRRDGNKKWCAAAFEMLGRRGLLIKELENAK